MNFRNIVLAIFVVLGALGVAMLALQQSRPDLQPVEVVMWGMESESQIDLVISQADFTALSPTTIIYQQISPEDFDNRLLESLAAGAGPDLILLPHDKLIQHKDKLFPLSFDTYSRANFKDQFIKPAEIFIGREGIFALPFSVDPLIMYWNRDRLAQEGIVNAPQYWDEVQDMSDELTVRSNVGDIIEPNIGLGTYDNIAHAKKILSLLFFQVGNPMVVTDGDSYEAAFDESIGSTSQPAQSVLTFYTDFANPRKPIYTWNNSLGNSRDIFTAGDSNFYLGPASEYPLLEDKNPNLDIDWEPVPSVRGSETRTGYVDVAGIAIVRNSDRINSAYSSAVALTRERPLVEWSQVTGLPSVRRDIASILVPDSYLENLQDIALVSTSWLDPDPQATDEIFSNMISSLNSGQARISEAARRASEEVNLLFP